MENGYQYRGSLIRQCMRKKQVKNDELAKILGCSPRTITNYRSGEIPSRNILGKLIPFLEDDGKNYLDSLDYKKSSETKWKKRKIEGKPTTNFVLGYYYKNDTLYINKEEARIVQEIFKIFVECGNRALVSRELANKGFASKTGKQFSIVALTKILSNPIYIGKRYIEGELVPGNWPGIIDEELFVNAEKILRNKRKRRKSV